MRKILFFIFVFFANVSMSQSFVQNLGTSKLNDGATSIAASEKGFYIAGYTDQLAYLLEIDQNGNILWKKEFDFTEQADLITHISVKDNFILGCGYGYLEGSGNYLEFYFKFNVLKKEFEWVKRNNQKLKPANILPLDNGNFLVSGDVYAFQEFKFFLLELNPTNGKSIKYTTRKYSGRESSSTLLIHENFIYSGGRYGLEAKLDKFRGAISKFDLNYTEVWSNYYLNKKEKYLRNYLSKIIIDNQELVSLFSTNNFGINSAYTASIAKQNLDGEMLWAKEISLPGYKNITVKDLKASSDGYYIFGYTKSPTENILIIKTDKEGNAEWAKTYGSRFKDNIAIDQGNFIEINNKSLYVIGQSINIGEGSDYDGFLMRLNLDGSTDNNCWKKEEIVDSKTFEELVQGSINLNRKDSIIRNFNVGYKLLKDEERTYDFFCYPKFANNDFDTIRENKSIIIEHLKNDIVKDDETIKTKIIRAPLLGTTELKEQSIHYRQNSEECALDSFQYEIYSEIGTKDTATVYVYSENTQELLNHLKDTVLPENSKLVLDATLPNAEYLWSTMETTPSISITTFGSYTVQVAQNGCLSSKSIEVAENPYSFENIATNNISFLLDFSISMNRNDRLPILKESLYKIMKYMRVEDKLSMINYTSEASILFNGIQATAIQQVKDKLDGLSSEGRSNIKKGLEQSFKTLLENYSNQGNNRIIFTTDGDISNEQRESLIKFLNKNLPENTYFSIFLFNEASIFQKQMQEVAEAANGEVFVVTPKNIEKILLNELKAVKK